MENTINNKENVELVNVIIDNQKLKVPNGITILEAARIAKIDIPTLCFLKDINEVGDCRMCIVKVEGRRGFVASCIQKVEERNGNIHKYGRNNRSKENNIRFNFI